MARPDATEREDRTSGRWARPYAVVPLVAVAAAGGLAVVDPLRFGLGPVRYAGALPVVAGAGLVARTAVTFGRAGETLSPVARPARLVTGGPLAATRNPMYLGVVVAVAGVAVLAGSPAVAGYAAALWLAYHAIVVLVEEPKLREAFGRDYDQYCERVPRWLPRGGR